MTIFLARAFDTPEDPFRGGALRAAEPLAYEDDLEEDLVVHRLR